MTGPTAEQVANLRVLLQAPWMTLKDGKSVCLLMLHFNYWSHTDAACNKLRIHKNSPKNWAEHAYKGGHYAGMRDVLRDFVSRAC
jgi:hypothetical protein